MNYLLIKLAVADIIYATCTIPNMVLTHSSIQPNGATEKVLYTFGTFFMVGAASSVLTLVTVAEERYWSVMYYYDGGKKTLTMRKLRVYNKSITVIKVNLRQNGRQLYCFIAIRQFHSVAITMEKLDPIIFEIHLIQKKVLHCSFKIANSVT